MEDPLKSSIFESPDLNEHISLPQASQYFTVGRPSRRQLLRVPRPKQCRSDVGTPNVELWILYYTVPLDVESIEFSCYFWDIKCCITAVCMTSVQHIHTLNINPGPHDVCSFVFPRRTKTESKQSDSTYSCIPSESLCDECFGFHIYKHPLIKSQWECYSFPRINMRSLH